MYGHTYSKSMDQPGKVLNLARGQLNRENEYFPIPVRAWELGLATRFRQSRPASACSSPYSGGIGCLLTGSLPISTVVASIYLSKPHTPSGQSRVIRSHNCVPMAFTAESPPAQGQYTSRQFQTGATLAGHHRPINTRLVSHTHY